MLVLVIAISLLLGALSGWFLARRGVTANNALQHHQRQVYIISCTTLGVATLLFILMVAGKQSPWVPNFLLIYIGSYFWDFILAVCCFCTGFFLLLELPGWKEIKRLRQLILFLIVSISAAGYLAYYEIPITDLVQNIKIRQGVVLQTTPYSCSAATIATLARFAKPELKTTERNVVALAGTSRLGTSVVAEVFAMEKLGLSPQYERLLTVTDLVKKQQLALLHVMEPVGNKKLAHAVALLAVAPAQGKLILGNPNFGIRVKSFAQMKDYWLGEAIFVTSTKMRGLASAKLQMK